MTAQSRVVYEWGTDGDGEGQFDDPTAIAAAPDGSLYVSEMSNRVQKFTSKDVFVTKWGEYGHGDGEFGHPYGVGVASGGIVLVVEGTTTASRGSQWCNSRLFELLGLLSIAAPHSTNIATASANSSALGRYTTLSSKWPICDWSATFFSNFLIRCVSATFIPPQLTGLLALGLAVCQYVHGRYARLHLDTPASGQKLPGGHSVRFQDVAFRRLSALRTSPS
jgi:hypothetical protein